MHLKASREVATSASDIIEFHICVAERTKGLRCNLVLEYGTLMFDC